MAARPDDGALSALLRLISARAPKAEIAVYAIGPAGLRLAATTSRDARLAADRIAENWSALAPIYRPILAAGGCARIDPASFGLTAGFGALAPLHGPDGAATGFLLVSDPRWRRLGPKLAAALLDAALIAAPLLAPAGRTAAARSPPTEPAAALSHCAALRTIDLVRAGAPGPWSLLLLAIDRLDPDAAAAAAAEDATFGFAARLEACLSPGDRLAWLEDGRILVLTARTATVARSLAASLLAAARRPLARGGVRTPAWIGVSEPASALHTPSRTLLGQAEASLRRARQGARDDESRPVAPREPGRSATGGLERDLAKAAARGQLRLVYQAYVDLADGAISGVEALLRWRHPARGELAPAAFIPLAEASGLILPLGGWALRAALAAAANWPRRLALSVNVSALQFHQPGFVAEVEAALAGSGVAPERLELEITETVLMRDNPETTAQLEALIARGVRIALDDFGTGYSALAYLGRLPHHRIKLDRAFVQDLGNPATLELVRAIIALARRTGVAVTAEGVERPDQLRLVRGLGFTHAQGFVTGPPVADPVALLDEPLPAY